jgi:guanosine-3',5'-bis(diphosphate) 3'-pyrophosphohydrolase
MTNIAFEAMKFAREIHAPQRRKYTGNPYADHLAEVAGIVATVSGSHPDRDVTTAVAWLHDSVEDQNVSNQELVDRFGHEVMNGVMLLSDLEEGNRRERKAAGRVRLANAPGWVQDIKVADLISNTSSIVMHDPKFAVVYLDEKRMMLEVMTKANRELVAIAMGQTTQ